MERMEDKKKCLKFVCCFSENKPSFTGHFNTVENSFKSSTRQTELESIQQQDLKDQNMYTHLNGIHHGNSIQYTVSIMNPIEMCVPVLILKAIVAPQISNSIEIHFLIIVSNPGIASDSGINNAILETVNWPYRQTQLEDVKSIRDW